jgi:hypothetical protein
MVDREEMVLLSADRLGRVAIVRRPDGFFCIYSWWHWPIEAQQKAEFNAARYYDAAYDIETSPVSGIYETIQDAEKEARRLLSLGHSTLH